MKAKNSFLLGKNWMRGPFGCLSLGEESSATEKNPRGDRGADAGDDKRWKISYRANARSQFWSHSEKQLMSPMKLEAQNMRGPGFSFKGPEPIMVQLTSTQRNPVVQNL